MESAGADVLVSAGVLEGACEVYGAVPQATNPSSMTSARIRDTLFFMTFTSLYSHNLKFSNYRVTQKPAYLRLGLLITTARMMMQPWMICCS